MRRTTLAGALLALAAAGLLVALQPLRGDWWHSADPDGAYVGNSLNILLGNHTHYLDHPGLPTQDALALTFGAQYLLGKATGSSEGREAFVDGRMLDLDSARPLYRAWALLLFFGATLLVYTLVLRLLGHWTWGLAGAVLFVSTPALAPISYILRPDGAVAALCLAVGYFTVTGFDRRSPTHYTAAALLLGLAMTFKLPAVGMGLPLAIAVVWRPPGAGWFRETTSALGRRARRHAAWLVPAALAWLTVCWLFNRERLPIVQTDDQRSLLVTGATFLGGYALFAFVAERFRIPWADRLFRLSYAWLLVAFAVGMAIPASLVLDDGVQMLVAMKETLAGGRLNENVEPFADFELAAFFRSPMSIGGGVMALGLVAGLVGVVRRCHWAALLAGGTLVLAAMAAARYSVDYYYAPAFAVAIPGALWLLRRGEDRHTPLYVWVPVLLVLGWTITHQGAESRASEIDAAAQELADELLAEGQVALVSDYYFPIEDVRFDSLVDGFVDHVPRYPYRFLSRPETARDLGLTPAYYVARAGDLPAGTGEVHVGRYGPFVVETLALRWGPERELGVARIVQSPLLEP